MVDNFGFQGGGSGGFIPPVTLKYGSFYDTTDQFASLPNTAYAMQLNSVDLTCTNGFSIQNDGLGKPTRIKAQSTGIYNLLFSAQMYRNSGGTKETIDVWLRTNEIDVPFSNTHATIQANADFIVLAWNFFVKLNANEYTQLMWATTSTNISIQSDPAGSPHPETPSVIVTINQVSN